MYNPSSSSWKATQGRFSSEEEYRNYLYSKDRLDARVALFIHQSLPIIDDAAKRHPIIHVVSYSSNLPTAYRRILETATERFPFLVLDEQGGDREPLNLETLASEYLSAHNGPKVYGAYRLDDDDLLASTYFDQMAPYVEQQYAGMQVSLARGYTALYTKGVFKNLRETYWPMLAIGLMSICFIDKDGTLKKPSPAPHHVSDRFNPVVIDAREVSYLWVRHAEQDTALAYDEQDSEASVLAHMSRYPAADGLDFRTLFPHSSELARHEHTVLLGNTALLTPEVHLPFQNSASAFRLKFKMHLGDNAVKNNALVSFHIEGDVDDLQSKLQTVGIATSTNPAIGPYRYLDTSPGEITSSCEVVLPKGMTCTGVTVKKFRQQETYIAIDAAEMTTL